MVHHPTSHLPILILTTGHLFYHVWKSSNHSISNYQLCILETTDSEYLQCTFEMYQCAHLLIASQSFNLISLHNSIIELTEALRI